jgi:hypothetical protein
MFAVTTEPDPETGLSGVSALVASLDAAGPSPRTLHLLAFGAPRDELILDADPLRPARVAAALVAVASRAGGRAFRISGSTFALLVDRDGDGATMALDARGALERVAPALARGLLYGSAEVPVEPGHGQRVLREALAVLSVRDAWQPQSAARQASDVLVQLLCERNLAGRGPQRMRIAAHAVAIGRELDRPPAELHEIVRAAELQDVGLLVLPEALLQKSGALDADEWERVRRHPLAGQRIVAAATALAGVARLVRSCYERFDGSGYPDGLAGDEIPLGARIIAVCVAYEAMVAGRPYRAPRAPREALVEIEACSGLQFDPIVVDAFRAVHRA